MRALAAFLGVLAASVALLLAGRTLGRRRPRIAACLQVLAFGAIVGCWYVGDRPDLQFRFLPHGAYVYLEAMDFVPFAVLFLALSLHQVRWERLRRVLRLLIAAMLAWVAGWAAIWFLTVRPSTAEERVEDGVCMQSSGWTCAAAAMTTVLRSHGVPAREAEMASLAHTGFGTSPFKSAVALERKLDGLPFRVELRRAEWKDVPALPLPCLVAYDWGPDRIDHMSVIEEVLDGGEGVLLADPLDGRTRMTREEFVDRWHRYVILVRDLRR